MKQAFKIVWEIVSIPLEAILRLLTLGFSPFLIIVGIITIFSYGVFGGFAFGYFLVRKFRQIMRSLVPFFIWFVAFSLLLFFPQAIHVLCGAPILWWQGWSGAAIGAVLFQRYIAKPLIYKVKTTMQQRKPAGSANQPVYP